MRSDYVLKQFGKKKQKKHPADQQCFTPDACGKSKLNEHYTLYLDNETGIHGFYIIMSNPTPPTLPAKLFVGWP